MGLIIDTPRYAKRRDRSLATATGILLELCRRRPDWQSGIADMVFKRDGTHSKNGAASLNE